MARAIYTGFPRVAEIYHDFVPNVIPPSYTTYVEKRLVKETFDSITEPLPSESGSRN